MKRRAFLGAGGALLLSACASPPRGSVEATEVPAPQWRVGDTWTYRCTDGYNSLPRGVLTRTVDSVTPDGVRFVTTNETGVVLDDALFVPPGDEVSGTLSEDGPVIGVFSPKLRKYDFPLVSGKQWRQSLVRTDANGYRNWMSASTRIEGWQNVRAGGRTYRAIVIRRNLMLGPKDAFSGNLYREELEWYVPELRGAAQLRTHEYMVPRGSVRASVPRDRFLQVLEAIRLG